jgi:hypothetical protein
MRLTEQIAQEWLVTKERWRDEKSHAFEEQYLEVLFADAGSAATVHEKLQKLIHKVRTDCE